jgi:hypothetical protein
VAALVRPREAHHGLKVERHCQFNIHAQGLAKANSEHVHLLKQCNVITAAEQL